MRSSLFPKTCACGRVHSREAWSLAPLLGTWELGEEVLELRNCACGSTMAIPVIQTEGR